MGLFRRKKRNLDRVEAQLESLQSELRSLQKQARTMAGHASKAAGNAYGAAEAAYDGVGTWTVDNLDTMRGSVRDQPLTALLISLGVGAMLGTLFLRR